MDGKTAAPRPAFRLGLVVAAALLCAAVLFAVGGMARAQGEYSETPEDAEGQPVEPPVDPEKGERSTRAQEYGLKCGAGIVGGAAGGPVGSASGCLGYLLPAVVADNPPQPSGAPPSDDPYGDCYPLSECGSSPAGGFPLDENPRYSEYPGYEGPPASASTSAAPAPAPAAPAAEPAPAPVPAPAPEPAEAPAPAAPASASASPSALPSDPSELAGASASPSASASASASATPDASVEDPADASEPASASASSSASASPGASSAESTEESSASAPASASADAPEDASVSAPASASPGASASPSSSASPAPSAAEDQYAD